MEKLYTIISTGEDVHIEVITKDELERRLNEEYYGSRKIQAAPMQGQSIDLHTVEGIWIIDGAPIKPKAEEKVTRWSV